MELSISRYEAIFLENIKKILPEASDLKVDRRTSNYLSLVTCVHCGDFCRFKATANTLWISLDLWGYYEVDPRLAGVKNKNQRHWKIYLSSMDDLFNYADLISFSYNKIKKFFADNTETAYLGTDLNSLDLSVSEHATTQSKQFISSVSRPLKGMSLLEFPSNFVVLDLETTGRSPYYDSIIEIGALRIRNGKIIDTFSSLVKPPEEVSSFISQLTGITNEMLADAPLPKDIFPHAQAFIGNDIIVGHNINFDINFLYDWFVKILNEPVRNDFIDTLQIARKVLSSLPQHRLVDIAKEFDIKPNGFHRALCDCQTTFDCFCKLGERVSEMGGFNELPSEHKTSANNWRKLAVSQIETTRESFDENHPFYGKVCVFTGTLAEMQRKDAAQLVVDLGGNCEDRVTQRTNFLILGNNDYCKSIKDGKSNKHKKAEQLKLQGYDIEVIPESVFYEMIGYEEENT
ncbi:MAG: ribonuclease H-like domain-containing protein [Clostridia bacterium]|nr:ribonuclease H-like domain-containing protein [Clostridia bacterium]